MPALIPVEHFFENPEKAGGQISPDGTKLSYLAPENNRLNVWVRTIGEDDDVCVTHDHVRGISSYFWSRDSTRILYVQDDGGNENFHVLAAEVAKPEEPAVDLTPFPDARAQIVDVPYRDADHLLVSLNQRDPSLFDVHRLTVSTGELELVAENPGNIGQWLTDVDGRLLAAVAQTPAGDYEVQVRSKEDEPFRVLRVFSNEDDVNVYGFTPDGSALYVGTAEDADLSRLCTLDVTTGSLEVIDSDEEADLSGPIRDDETGQLLGAVYVRDRLVFHPSDAEFAAQWEQVDAIHPGDIASVSRDDSRTKWVVSFNDDREPGVTYFFDTTTGKSEYLFRPRPLLDPAALAPMEPVRIAARDGLVLRSYLTRPVDASPGEALPMVLLVHGGPWARDAWGYQPEVQFLANRGYAVLQVNYRGSTGFGKAFMHAAEQEFSGKMHDDLIDAVSWAIESGFADPARVGIYGGSYGGYATLVGLSFTPDVFACGIDYVGPSSLVTLIRSFPPYWRPFLQGSWFRFVGDPGTEEEPNREVEAQLLERSPIARVDRIKAPLMVVQGANDPRVTKLESDNIVEALRDRGVDVEYLVKDDEGHGFANPENRLDLYRAMERFFAKHLGGQSSEG